MNILVIGIYERTLRFLEVNAQREITFIKTVDTPFSFSECFKLGNFDDSIISEACSLIKEALKNINYSSSKVFLLLDTSFSFLNIVPIEISDKSSDNVLSFIVWDISNYFPENYKNFQINYYKLYDYKFAPNIKANLIVAIENSTLEIVRKIFHNCRMQINMFDLDFFAADKYATNIFVDNTYPLEIISVGCKRNKVELSISGQKGLRYYNYLHFKDSNYKNAILKLFSEVNEEIFLNQLKKAMVFGEDYAADVCKFLLTKFKHIDFKMPNPFDEFPKSDKGYIEKKHKIEGNKFIPLFGLLLKGF